MKQKQGSTLAELIVVLSVTAMILLVIFRAYFAMEEQKNFWLAKHELEENLAMAIEYIRQDALLSASVEQCDQSQLTLVQYPFQGAYFLKSTVKYTLKADPQKDDHLYQKLTGNVLYRKESSQSKHQPVANFITALTYRYLDDAGEETMKPENVRRLLVTAQGNLAAETVCLVEVIPLGRQQYVSI